MPTALDLRGFRSGKLTAVERLPDGFWRCVCDCGEKTKVKTGALHARRIRSCGCARPRDRVGERHEMLTVIEMVGRRPVTVRVRCDCGTVKVMEARNLDHTKSCGCLLVAEDLTGQRYGRWIVLGRDWDAPVVRWWVYCDCEQGAIGSVNGASLRSGGTQSCGCLTREVNAELRRAERGPDPSYTAVHHRLPVDLGPASRYQCVDCEDQADQWSYDHLDPDERWAWSERNQSFMAYSVNLDHYQARCDHHHRVLDHPRNRARAGAH